MFHWCQINKRQYCYVKDFVESGYLSGFFKKYKKTKVANVGCAFDIETSKVGDYSFMYVWQFAIDDLTVIGRSWDDFNKLLKYINDSNDSGASILCWVHNFPFEFSFMKNYVNWNIDENGKVEIFAIDRRKPVYGKVGSIEFRDSLVLTNKKLEMVAEDYQLGVEKLSGNLDYTLVRLPSTELTDSEIAYCINDVQILSAFFHKYIKKEYLDSGYKIPLTSTGIVRNEMKRGFKKLNKSAKEKYRKKVLRGFPNNETEYADIMRWLYRGGYVHANACYTADKLVGLDMRSYDFKSSYPAVMLHEKYPYRFVSRETSFFEKIKNDRKWMSNNAFYGTFEFENIKIKSNHSVESRNKIFDESNAKYDNGRLVSADKITVCLTEIDWLIYNDFMTWDSVKCLTIKIASKEPLPDFLIKMIVKYFELKETIDKDSLDYLLIKMKLNALYGMCCTGLYNTEIAFEDGLLSLSSDKKDYESLVKKQLLLPWFGIWCTAYARYNLLHVFSKIGNDCVYGDTDSCKVINSASNQYIIDNYNNRMSRLNKKLPPKLSKIGMFDDEGKIWKFKTYGAKRYISDFFDKKNKKLKSKPTIAGLPKQAIIEHCHNKGLDIYDFFENEMKLSKVNSKKLRAKYIDHDFEIEVTDYNGMTETVNAESCCTLIETDFEMSVSKDYLYYYQKAKIKNERIVGDRV